MEPPCFGPSRQRGRALPRGLGDPLGDLQEIPGLPEEHGLDHSLTCA